jgi:RNA polymerase sigma factor (sigma-70 family)
MDERKLLETAGPIVARRAKRTGLSLADREDVLQDVVVKYLAAFPTDEPRNLAAWIERTTERLLIDRHRAADRRPQASWPEDGDPPAISTLVAAWREATATSLGAMKRLVVGDALSLLSESDREIFERKYLHCERSVDIAAGLGVPVNNIDQRAGRARRRLRAALKGRHDLLAELVNPHPRVY